MPFDPLSADAKLFPEDTSTGDIATPKRTFDPVKADASLFPSAGISRAASGINPAQASQEELLAKKHGLQPDTVRTLPEDVEAIDLQRRIDTATPTVRSALMDIEFAKQAKGDIENLNWIERTLTNLWPAIKEGVGQGGRGVGIAALDNMGSTVDPDFPRQSLGDLTGIRDGERLKQVQESAKQRLFDEIMASDERVEAMTPQNLDIVQRGIRSGLISLATQSPGFAATLITRSPAPMLVGMSGFEGFSSYGEARSEGRGAGQSALYGGINGMIEFITEKFPTQALVDTMGPAWKKGLADFAVGELMGEQVATLTQSLNSLAFGLDEELAQATTLGEKARIQAERQAVTVVSTLVAGGAQIGAARTIGELESRIRGGESDQLRLARLANRIENSELRKNNPARFKELLARIGKNTDSETVYLDPDQAQVYFQSQPLGDDVEINPAIAAIRADIPRAIEEGRFVEIPIEAYADMVGTEELAGLMPHMKLDPDALTASEAQNADIQARIDALVAMDHEERQAGSEVYNAVLGQLVTAEDRSTAESHAILWEATFQTLADRPGIKAQGLTAFDLYQRYNPTITREIDPKVREKLGAIDQIDTYLDRLRSGDVPRESDMFGQSVLEFIREKGGLADEGGELAAMDADVGKTKKNRLTQENGRSLDDMAELLAEAGYIPERSEAAILAAIDSELRGSPVYALGTENQALMEVGQLLNELEQMLDEAGIDITQMTNAEIKAAIQEVSADGVLEQGGSQTDSPEFKAWFGDSKVVDENGEPLVVYHGTDQSFDAFDPEKTIGGQFWFTTDKAAVEQGEVGAAGRGVIVDAYLSIKNPAGWKEYDQLTLDELIARGYDGLALPDSDGTTTYVAFEPTQIKSATGNRGTFDPDDVNILKQKSDTAPRGHFNPATNTLTLTPDADLSTFLHESAHFFLEVMRDLAPMDEGLQADLATLEAWWADNGATDTVQRHEMFASGFEAYLMEGKAPTPELQSLFTRFGMWLTMVYKRVQNAFKRNGLGAVELSDEVRQVMDRLVASQEAIDNAQRQQGFDPIAYETLGLSPEDAAALQVLATEAEEDAYRELTTDVMREIQRERDAWWKKGVAEKAKGIAAELDQQQDYLARDFLSGDRVPEGATPFKLNRAYIRDIYGKSAASKLGKMSLTEGGMHPDLAAPLLGYSSGDALVRALLGTLNKAERAKMVKALATEAMRAEHGDRLTDGTIAEEAQRAVHSDKRAQLLLAELRLLNKAAGRKTTPQSIFKAAAEQTVSEAPVYKLRPDVHLRNEAKARNAALKAAADGDAVKAALESHKALRQFYLYRESLKAKQAAEKIGAYGRSFKGKKLDRIKKSGDHFYGQIASILEKFEFRVISDKKIARRQSMRDWIEKTMVAAGEGSPFQNHEAMHEDDKAIADQASLEDVQGVRPDHGITDAMLVEAERRNYRTLTLPQLEAVEAALKSVEHLSRLKNKLLTQKNKRELEAWVNDLIVSVERNAPAGKKKLSFGSTRSRSEELGRGVSAFMDITRTPTSLLKMLDGYGNDGVAWELIGRPLQDAAAEETERLQEANQALEAIFARYSRSELGAMNRKFFEARVNDDLTKHDVISILLNWGNEGGRQRVLDGFNFDEDTAHYLMNTYLDAKDYAFAQDVWAYLETLKADAFALHNDLFGFTPEEVEALPFESKFGTMPGGYYPIKYDTAKSAAAEQHSIAGLGDSFTSSIQGKKKLGSNVARLARVVRPLNTDMTQVIFGHVSDVIHQVTHDRALFDAGRILANDGVKHSITVHYGEHVYRQLTTALRNLKEGTEPAKDILDKVAIVVRNNATLAMLGASLRTVILQPFGVTNSFVKARLSGIGALGLANGYALYMKNPAAAAKHIREESTYMRNREEVQSVAIRRIKNKIRNAGTLDVLRESVMIPIVKTQFYAVDAPLYMAARDHFIANGMEREKAVGLAEQVVRDAQGGGGTFDTAEAMQGVPWKKLFTNFLTYSITTYNLQAENFQRARKGELSWFDATVNTFVLMTMPAILTMLLNMVAGGDDEDPAVQLAAEQAAFLLSMNPLLAQFSGLVQGFDYGGPQGTALVSKVGQFGWQVGQGEVDDALIRSGIWAVGLATGLPAAQINRTVFGLKQASDQGDDALTTVKKAAFGPERNN